MVPLHSNNASIHFLSSTLPLSKRLKLLAPNALSSISFPQILHGHRLSFFPNPSQEFNHNSYFPEIIEGIPSTFWLSRVLHKVPMDPKFRKKSFMKYSIPTIFYIAKQPPSALDLPFPVYALYVENHQVVFIIAFVPLLNNL